jgi:hypothetical protein
MLFRNHMISLPSDSHTSKLPTAANLVRQYAGLDLAEMVLGRSHAEITGTEDKNENVSKMSLTRAFRTQINYWVEGET